MMPSEQSCGGLWLYCALVRIGSWHASPEIDSAALGALDCAQRACRQQCFAWCLARALSSQAELATGLFSSYCPVSRKIKTKAVRQERGAIASLKNHQKQGTIFGSRAYNSGFRSKQHHTPRTRPLDQAPPSRGAKTIKTVRKRPAPGPSTEPPASISITRAFCETLRSPGSR